jgi:hypothetical protein
MAFTTFGRKIDFCGNVHPSLMEQEVWAPCDAFPSSFIDSNVRPK